MAYDQFNYRFIQRFKHQAPFPPKPTEQEKQVCQPDMKILAGKSRLGEEKNCEPAPESQ